MVDFHSKPEHIKQLILKANSDPVARAKLSDMGKRGAATANASRVKKKECREKFEQMQLLGLDWWNK